MLATALDNCLQQCECVSVCCCASLINCDADSVLGYKAIDGIVSLAHQFHHQLHPCFLVLVPARTSNALNRARHGQKQSESDWRPTSACCISNRGCNSGFILQR